MSNREALYRKIKEVLEKESGLKARKIAKLISAEKRDVNRLLYLSEYSNQFRRDSSYVWYLAEDAVKDSHPAVLDIESITRPRKADLKKTESCKKCMLYKSGECIGEKKTCSHFKNSPEISAYEMAMWPTQMSGPYGTLHKNQKHAF